MRSLLPNPPTHDDWNPDALQRPQKTYVSVALKRIREELRDYLSPASTSSTIEEQVSTGELADSLRVLAVGAGGGRANGLSPSKRRRAGGSHRSRERKTVEILSSGLLPHSQDSTPGQVTARMRLRAPRDVDSMTVTPDLSVVVEGGGPIRDLDQVRVDSWTTETGESTGGDSLEVHGGDVFFVDISYPENVAVNCVFRSEAVT